MASWIPALSPLPDEKSLLSFFGSNFSSSLKLPCPLCGISMLFSVPSWKREARVVLLNCKLLEGRDCIFVHFKLSLWHRTWYLVDCQYIFVRWNPEFTHCLSSHISWEFSLVLPHEKCKNIYRGFKEKKIKEGCSTVMKQRTPPPHQINT